MLWLVHVLRCAQATAFRLPALVGGGHIEQINRTIDNGERDLRLSDLSGSSSIENDSNIVLLLFNNAAEAKNTKSVGRMGAGAVARNLDGTGDDVIITIEKNRLGTGGRCVLKWESDVCRFIDPTKPAIDSPIPALSF